MDRTFNTMNRIKDVFDGDTCRVLIASALPAGLTLADASAITAIAAGLVSIAYTVKKWRDSNRKNRKRRHHRLEDTES